MAISTTELFLIFLLCDFGGDVASRFNDVDINLIFPIIILNTRRAIFVAGYGNAPVSRETFKKVNSFIFEITRNFFVFLFQCIQ